MATERDASHSTGREPASSLETKKEIANQGISESDEPPSRLLNGEWRSVMTASGFDWEAFYFLNGVSNQSGGLKTGGLGFSTFDLMIHLDLEKTLSWTGGSLHLHHHTHNAKASPSEYSGDFMGVNSYAPPDESDSFLSQAYFQQSWADGDLDAVMGLYDFSSEFFVTDSSLVFLNNGFLLGAEAYPPSTGSAALSVYPINGPAIRLKYVYDKQVYVMAGMGSAVSRDPNFSNGTHPRMGKDEGNYQIVETGITQAAGDDMISKVAVGGWGFTNDFDKIDGSGEKARDTGMYAIVDYHITDSIAGFVRFGQASKVVADVIGSSAAGATYTGVFTEDDQFGFGFAQANRNTDILDDTLVATESVLELVYRIEPTPGVVITPDFQKISNPSWSKAITEATVASIRLELAF
jgi:carbohydrate-selective porin OprB